MTDYVERFAELYDQLSAYEDVPDSLYYTTRFIDGLKPGVRMSVALQKPQDLDTAYDIALLHEELSDTNSSPFQFKKTMIAASTVQRDLVAADRRPTENGKGISSEDKWGTLRTYRKSKGLCFTCGERWLIRLQRIYNF